MKIITCSLAILLSFISFGTNAQQQSICANQFTLGNGPVAPAINSFASVDRAKDIINNIMRVIGLKANFEIRPANIDNAAAVIYQQKRYVLYNPSFIAKLNQISKNEWASVSVLAHEIGHHLNGHTLDNKGSLPAKELEADEFSGFVLERMGANLQEAQLAMKLAASTMATETHPGQYDRLAAIARGWNNADHPVKMDVAINQPSPSNSRNNAATMAQNRYPAVRTEPPAPPSASFIIADLHFHFGDPQMAYYATSQMKIVGVKNNQIFRVGDIAATNDTNFPFLISDKANTRYYIDRSGQIVSTAGKKVGTLEKHRE